MGSEMCIRDSNSYGWIIIGVNWVPGIVASMHIIHMYRTKLPAKKTLLYTGKFCIYVKLLSMILIGYLLKTCIILCVIKFNMLYLNVHFSVGICFVAHNSSSVLRISPLEKTYGHGT